MHRATPLPSRIRLAAALLGAALLAGTGPAVAQQKPDDKRMAPAPKDRDDPVSENGGPGEPPPAGMVRFPGGTVTIGIDRKDLKKLIDETELGRRGDVATSVENEFSPSTPAHQVTLPPFFIGKYEVTNAMWDYFLQHEAREVYVVPGLKEPGARTLEEIARRHLLTEPFRGNGGEDVHICTVPWYQLYDINEETINPTKDADGKAVDAAARLPKPQWRHRPLLPGTRIVTFRRTLPEIWITLPPGERFMEHYLPGTGDMPVTAVSLVDAVAFARTYGCHVPTDYEWEAAARGDKGSLWPEGSAGQKSPDFAREFNPLGHAWKGFDAALGKEKARAAKELPRAKERLEKARAGGAGEDHVRKLEREVADLEWIASARAIDPNFKGDIISQWVGSYPMGTSPCGAMDMIGNVDEWTSNRLFPYPGNDSTSPYLAAVAWSVRGGNIFDMDTVLQASFRKFLGGGLPIQDYFRFRSTGFRVARYTMPGASAALPVVQALRGPDARGILPGTIVNKFDKVYLDLAPYGTAGVERLHEVRWSPGGSPANDPEGKIFHLGPARSIALVPADRTPFRDLGALRKGCDGAAIPPEGQEDNRDPWDIPFLGILHLTPGMEIKGDRMTVQMKEVPLTGDALKRWQEERKARKEAEEAEKKAEEEPEKKDGGDGGGDGSDPGGAAPGDGGPAKGGGGKGDGEKGEGATPPAEGEKKEEEPEPTPTRTVKEFLYGPGFLRGEDHSGGLMVGWVKFKDKRRPALWEAKRGTGGTLAPGGGALLGPPIMVLGEEDVVFKKASRVEEPGSRMDEGTGEVNLRFFLPIDKTSGAIEVVLTLHLGDYKTGDERPWRQRPWEKK